MPADFVTSKQKQTKNYMVRNVIDISLKGDFQSLSQ
jgi:hypothetical protein